MVNENRQDHEAKRFIKVSTCGRHPLWWAVFSGARSADARTGPLVIDLTSGQITDWVRIEGVIYKLFDVAELPGIRNPSAIGLKGTEISRLLSIDPA